MALAIDTLRYAQRLRDAGMPQQQAEAFAEATHDFLVPELATKADLNALGTELRTEIAALEQRILHAMTRQTLAMIGSFGALVVAGIGVLAFLLRAHP